MKTIKNFCYLILFIFIVICGCHPSTAPLSENEKDQIKKEVKEIFDDAIKAANAHDAASMASYDWNSPDYLYAGNGTLMKGWETKSKVAATIHSNPVYQSYTVNIDEVIMNVISREAVMLTATGKFGNFPSGSESRDIPFVCTYLFEKKEGKWVMTVGHESTTEKLSPEGKVDLDSEVAKELDQVWQDYIAASNSGDLDKTMTFLTDDYVNMPGYGTTQTGKEENRVFFKYLMDNLKLKVNWYKQSEVFVHGNMAYAFGTFEMINHPPDGKNVKVLQRSLTVYKKDNEGKWKLYRWMGQD